MTACASCACEIERREGAGRPNVYCSGPCRRMAEFQVRGLVKRIDQAELELRELLGADAGKFQHLDKYERDGRARLLKRRLAADRAKLLALLGGGNGKP